jgi:glycosyltransferase involved in cell wall biosynthesis
MNKIKIALITNFATHYRYPLFNLLSQSYGFDLFFFDDPEKTKEDIQHLKIYTNEFLSCYLKTTEILKIILNRKYDAIIKCTNNKWSFIGSFLVAKLIRAKFIVWHSIWYYPETLQYKLFSWLLLKILRDYSDAIVVYGKHGKRFLVEKGINPERIFNAWQTVENKLYGKKIKRAELERIRAKFNISNKRKVILYVGRLVVEKGIFYLLKGLNMLDKTKFIFVVVGDGSLRDQINNHCEKNQIDFRMVGVIPYHKLPVFYKLANLLVLPSITTKTFKEPWGLVVNEAFNQSCPVIVTDAVGAGVGGLVKDGVNGFVVLEKDSKALAEVIDKILNDNSLRERLSKKAKEEIKLWTYERQAKGFLDAVRFCNKEDKG